MLRLYMKALRNLPLVAGTFVVTLAVAEEPDARAGITLGALTTWSTPARDGADAGRESAQRDNPARDVTSYSAWIDSVLDSVSSQVRQQVESGLGHVIGEGASRRDALGMMSCTLNLHGNNEATVVVCALFLREFAPVDPASADMSHRLAQNLASFKLSETAMELTKDGPKFHPQWGRAGRPPDQRLRQAITAYEYLAELTKGDHAKAEALAMTGWVSRALGDWDMAIACWDRCATECSGTEAARNALWYAAEDLQNTRRAQAAADRLRRFIEQYPNDARVGVAQKRIQLLAAESQRTEEYARDPIASLKNEVEAANGTVTTWEACIAGMRWLELEGQGAARERLALWAAQQFDWPVRAKVGACMDAVSLVLARNTANSQKARLEGVDLLQRSIESADRDPKVAPLVHQLADLFCQLGQYDEAVREINRFSQAQTGSVEWRTQLDLALIHTTLSRDGREAARHLLAILSDQAPKRADIDQLRAVVEAN